MSAKEARSILDSAARTTGVPGGRSAAGVPSVGPQAVPVDGFEVAVAMYQSFMPANGRVITGQWDFRNDFINGSDPDDVATLSTTGAGGCQRITGITRRAWDWNNVDFSGRTYTKDGGVTTNSPLVGIDDATSAFRMLTDHGEVTVTTAPTGAAPDCRTKQLGAQFIYEHNQDESGNGWSAEASFGFLSVSYDLPGASVLQKSTNPVYL